MKKAPLGAIFLLLKMASTKQKLIVIVGPTASGKSELAVVLAKNCNGEIISADSRQVYRGLDVGTGKVAGAWRHAPAIPAQILPSTRSGAGIRITKNKGSGFPIKSGITIQENKKIFTYKNIPHYCIDFVSPKKIFSVAKYKECAERAIEDISSQGKIPLIVGGTGFWIDTVVYGIDLPDVPPHPAMRKKLEKKSVDTLFALLSKCAPERARSIEQKNPRRLIRAIEIARAHGKAPNIRKKARFDTLWIGLNPSYETWSHTIKRRVSTMLRRGLILETKTLLIKRVSRKRIREFGFEYRAVLDFMDKRATDEELLCRIIRDTIRYGRRQMRWWKRNTEITWIQDLAHADRVVQDFLTNPGH